MKADSSIFDRAQAALQTLGSSIEENRRTLAVLEDLLQTEQIIERTLIQQAHAGFEQLEHAQDTCVAVLKELGCADWQTLQEAVQSIDALRVEQQAGKEIREALRSFALLTSDAENVRVLLLQSVERANHIADSTLVGALPGEAQPYLTFMDCVDKPADARLDERLDSLEGHFESTLILALTRGKVYRTETLPPEANSDAPPTCALDAPVEPIANPPIYTQKTEPATLDTHCRPADVLLRRVWKDKGRFGTKAFESDLRDNSSLPYEIITATAFFGLLTEEQYINLFCEPEEIARKKALVILWLERLFNRGYLAYYEDTSTGERYYILSFTGGEALTTKSSRALLEKKGGRKLARLSISSFGEEFEADRIRRCVWCVDTALALWDKEGAPSLIFNEMNAEIPRLRCEVSFDGKETNREFNIVALPTEMGQPVYTPVTVDGHQESILYVSREGNLDDWRPLLPDGNCYLATVPGDGTIHFDRPFSLLEPPAEARPEESAEEQEENGLVETAPVEELPVEVLAEEISIEEIPAAAKPAERPSEEKPAESETSKSKTMQPDRMKEIMEAAKEMLLGARPDCALLYLRAEKLDESPELTAFTNRLAFASGDPLFAEPCTPEIYQTIFDGSNISEGEEELYSYLAAAGMLRLFVWPGSNDHYESWVIQQFQEDKQNQVFKDIPELRSAFRQWTDFIDHTRRGYDERMIQRLRQRSAQEQQRVRCCKAALDGLDVARHFVHGKFNHKKSEQLVRAFFGSGGDLHAALTWAAQDQQDSVELAKVYCDEFIKNTALLEVPFEGDDFDPIKIGAALDKVWNRQHVNGGKGNDTFKGNYRTTAMKKATDLLTRVANWAYLDNAGKFDDSHAQQMTSNLVEQLVRAKASLAAKMAETPSAGGLCLTAVADEFVARLGDTEGRPFRFRKYFYVNLLRSCHTELDENYLPVLSREHGLNLNEYTLVERVLAHWRDMKEMGGSRSWEDRLSEILQSDSLAADDYGSGAQICNYLADVGDKTDRPFADYEKDLRDNRAAVAATINERLARFTGDVEMAQNYGWLGGEGESGKFLRAVNLRSEQSDRSGNYGFLFRMMQACKERIEREAEHRAPAMEAQYRDLLESKHGEVSEWPILEDIHRMISERMYTIAEDYIGQVRKSGMRKLPARSGAEGKDYLRKFLAQYDKIFLNCNSLKITLPQLVEQRLRGHPETRDTKSAKELAQSWPNGGVLEAHKVATLLEQISLPVAALPNIGEGKIQCTVQLKQPQGNIADYAHPIAAFGSQALEHGLKILVLFGQRTDESILDEVRRLTGRQNTIILLDSAIPIQARRKLAQRLKELSVTNEKAILLLDRVLLLYLTTLPQAERLLATLQCTLPFSYYQPYRGTGHIPPEMFMGRKRELAEIRGFDGANLVYGGRQLGKTELLRRVVSLDHNPDQNSYAIYLSIKRKNAEETLAYVTAELCQAGILCARCASWSDLCDGIRRFLEEKTTPRREFRLLLDEADRFLESCSELGQQPIEQLKELQARRLHSFKFVLAGLRDVVRFDKTLRRGNSPFGHLRGITIQPLSYEDALELLEAPLYYLGFRIEGAQRRLIPLILARTNYYPGLIQFYCSQLVTSLADSYEISGYDERAAPPYLLSENHIKAILRKPSFLDEIKEKLFITLESKEDEEDLYSILAYALTYRCHDDRSAEGCSAEEILETCRDFGIKKITTLSTEKVGTLLLEMEELNVLLSSDGTPRRYLFNRQSFFQMMGTYDDVFDKLDEYSKKGGM